jgi:hypothetical protein
LVHQLKGLGIEKDGKDLRKIEKAYSRRGLSDPIRHRKLMGSASGSRKDIRATLDFSVHNHVLALGL